MHLPGELFVEYQLAAQAIGPERFVCVAAYGDYGPGYIGTEMVRAIPEKVLNERIIPQRGIAYFVVGAGGKLRRGDLRGGSPATSPGQRPAYAMVRRAWGEVLTPIGTVAAGTDLTLPTAGRADVPTDARAIVLNITAANPDATGYITAYPCDQPRPNASNLNFFAGQTVANMVAELGAPAIWTGWLALVPQVLIGGILVIAGAVLGILIAVIGIAVYEPLFLWVTNLTGFPLW